MPFRRPDFAARLLAGLLAGGGIAACALADGRFFAPSQGETLLAGSTLEVRWTAPPPGVEASNETELVLSLDGGLTFPIRVTAEMAVGTTSFRLRVPSLPTSHARLALRAGSGEGSETERIVFVSREFTISADPEAAPEDLVRGATEWWTRQAFTVSHADDLLPQSMTGAAERLVAPDFSPDISEPSPIGVHVLEVSAETPPSAGAPSTAPSFLDLVARATAPTTLRL